MYLYIYLKIQIEWVRVSVQTSLNGLNVLQLFSSIIQISIYHTFGECSIYLLGECNFDYTGPLEGLFLNFPIYDFRLSIG